jgi:hypothetical protein
LARRQDLPHLPFRLIRGVLISSTPDKKHPSSSAVQQRTEKVVLPLLEERLGVDLESSPIAYDGAKMHPDGRAADDSIFVEVFAHVGPLKKGQLHKVSTDVLKLVALRERYPNARLVLAFVDQSAADSVVGWRAAIIERHEIDRVVVELSKAEKLEITAVQAVQTMVNPEAPNPGGDSDV